MARALDDTGLLLGVAADSRGPRLTAARTYRETSHPTRPKATCRRPGCSRAGSSNAGEVLCRGGRVAQEELPQAARGLLNIACETSDLRSTLLQTSDASAVTANETQLEPLVHQPLQHAGLLGWKEQSIKWRAAVIRSSAALAARAEDKSDHDLRPNPTTLRSSLLGPGQIRSRRLRRTSLPSLLDDPGTDGNLWPGLDPGAPLVPSSPSCLVPYPLSRTDCSCLSAPSVRSHQRDQEQQSYLTSLTRDVGRSIFGQPASLLPSRLCNAG